MGVYETKWVKKLFYKISIAVVSTGVKYEIFADPSSVAVGIARSPRMIPDIAGEGESNWVKNAMREDDSDKKPAHIMGDSDEDILRNPPTHQGPSSFGTQQHPPYFSTLNLEAIGQQLDIDPTFGGQRLHERNPAMKFQIGQSFQTKEEFVLSVKDYSIYRGVKCRMIESDHLKADAAVTIKVLQEATETTYEFKPSYRKVLMSTMEGIVALLKTSLVRVDDQVDESTYGGTLLLAIAQDGNSNILPIAFALVKGYGVMGFFPDQPATTCDFARGYSGHTESTGHCIGEVYIQEACRAICDLRTDDRGAIGNWEPISPGSGDDNRAQLERFEMLHRHFV
ncbi:uncharacterized protein LOC130934902 [Arachis stenosperma]|uniref:uncharacterized protein LOC130934902 n=1 Tax=Arachis stenosperma TaxID=217475 RepID=UPI0025AD35BA|nr:uncharacterized protein LOC130934902 [Arachis stenosperma]